MYVTVYKGLEYNSRFYTRGAVINVPEKVGTDFINKGLATENVTQSTNDIRFKTHSRLHNFFEALDHVFTGGTEKTTPVDADTLPLIDSEDTSKPKWFTWANLKSLLKTYILYNGATSYWVDIDFPVIIRTTGVGIPTLETVQGNISAPQWQVNDYSVCEGQELIHPWKEGSEVNWHCHMITNGLDTADRFVKWEVEWFWINPSGAISATQTQSHEYTIPANTTDKTMFIVPIYAWTPTNGHIGGHVYARLKRITSTGLAPTNNPWCTMLQLHVECDTAGSREISAK